MYRTYKRTTVPAAGEPARMIEREGLEGTETVVHL
jgi:hypothetical protein